MGWFVAERVNEMHQFFAENLGRIVLAFWRKVYPVKKTTFDEHIKEGTRRLKKAAKQNQMTTIDVLTRSEYGSGQIEIIGVETATFPLSGWEPLQVRLFRILVDTTLQKFYFWDDTTTAYVAEELTETLLLQYVDQVAFFLSNHRAAQRVGQGH